MRMFRVLFASLLLTGVGGASAEAAEPFTGPHVEVFGGWKQDSDPLSLAGKSKQRNDVIYGGSAGYDLRFGNLVAGVSGEIGDSTAHSCRDVKSTTFSEHVCTRDGLTLFGGARIGYVVDPAVLLYAMGGYASARESGSFTQTYSAETVAGKGRYTSEGYRVGAGAELQLTSNIFTRLEYRYQRLGGDDAAKFHQHQVATAVGFRF